MKLRNLLLFILISPSNYVAIAQQSEIIIPKPTASQLAWQQAEMGAVFHYDLHVFDGKKYDQNGESGNRINPVKDYQIFNPEKLDTDQWIKSAKDAGFKFAILTATHETGFALFQSDDTPMGLKRD